MKFTLNWLLSHIKTDLNQYEIARKLTDLGIEVEEVIDNSKKFENFVIGFITKAEKHPDADKLQVCQVDIGGEVLNIVCGAANAREGIYVAVAKVGAFIPSFKECLKKGKIRGIESQGMLCSFDELMIDGDDNGGIIEIDGKDIQGTPLDKALGLDEIVFDVSITPNRADCFSVRGIAQDLAALSVGELLPLRINDLERAFENPVDVELKTEDCDYFTLTAAKNISGKTPEYIKKRLNAVGQKLIFPVVDIANYVCIDVGQPLHIFDMDDIKSSLTIRNSNQGEKITTLDGVEVEIPSNSVVVSSDDKNLSIAGIKGGEFSSFSNKTKNILIEAAHFNKISIAKTGQELRIVSDSRTRFERGIDPQSIDRNVEYTLSILSSICKCQISNTVKKGNIPSNQNVINLTYEKFNAITNLDEDEFQKSKEILKSLHMDIVSSDDSSFEVKTPSFRHDLEIEEDLIEEILRIVGFDKIEEEELPRADSIVNNYVIDEISKALVYSGFYEVKTFSFIDLKTAALFAKEPEVIKIKDALTTDFSVLRPSIIASHLKAVKAAQNKSQKNIKIFEIGKRFRKNGEDVIEENVLTLTLAGDKNNRNWKVQSEKVDAFDAKEILEKIFAMIPLASRLNTESESYFHPGRSGTYIIQKNTMIACLGEVHPSILSELDIKGTVVCFELILDNLPEKSSNKIKQPLVLSPYQPTMRDFSFIVSKQVKAQDIMSAVNKLRIEFVKDINVFDVYESSAIGEDKKAIGFELTLQSDKGTLTEEQIKDASDKISRVVLKEFNGILREQ